MNKKFYSKGFLLSLDKERLLKNLIKMKLTAFLLVFSALVSFGSTSNAQITFKAKNVRVEQVLKNITKQTGYRFIYEEGLLNKIKTDVEFKNATLNNSLNHILKDNHFDYSIHGNTIVIKPSKEPASSKVIQQITIKGFVKDSKTGLPIAGATVSEPGTSNVTQTDAQGNFTLKISSTSAKISIRMVGYSNAQISYSSSIINVDLISEDSELDEVVVVGFGKQKKESIVGAISTVSAKDLKVPTSTLSNAFAGRVSGVIAVQRGAEPGADGSNFWIRGISTFAGPSSPLIFIDGIESTITDMNNLPPEAIDNFSVLKDASATALYGARGANGVMLITTKRGGDFEKARINFRIENTFSRPTKPVEFANAVDYMEGYNYALTNRGLEPRFDQETKIEPTRQGLDPIAYPDVDWYNVMFKERAVNQYANFNVAGGGKKADYFVSANFTRDNGLLRKDPFYDFDNNIKIQRYNLLGNVGVNITEKTKAVIRLNSRLDDYNGANLTSSEIYSRLFTAPPALFNPTLPPNIATADHIFFGNLDGGPHPSGAGGNIYYNPYASMVTGFRQSFTSNNMAALEINQNLDYFLEGLTAKGLVSYANVSQSYNRRTSSPFYYEVSSFDNSNGSYEYTYRNITRGTTALSTELSSTGDRLMNLNFVLDWGRTFGDHGVSSMVAYLSRDYNPNNPGSFVNSLPTRNQGIAGRLTYQYKNRYFFEGNFGYNGSEAFSEGNRFGFFPSLAAGYMVSNEEFWQPIASTFSSLKIRGSWGIVGNAAVYNGSTLVRFPYLEEVNLTGRSFTFGDNWQTTQSGAVITKLGYPGATWEEGQKYNLGIDLSMFNNKLSLTADIFRENRDGIFMRRRTVPAEAGVVGLTPFSNLGKVKSSGFDANMSYNVNLTKDLYVNFRGTFTFAKNELINQDEPTQQFSYQSAIGLPLGLPYGFISEGYYKDDEDVSNSAISTYNTDLKPGDLKYKDLNEDGKIDAFDMTYFGDPSTPQIIYGFGVSSSYKKLDLSFFFQGAAKTSLTISGIHPFNNEASTIMQYLVGDYWTEENTDAMYPRMVTGANTHHNFHNSTHWMRDGSFVRLKNAEMGFTHKFARFFFSGQNLLTFSDFKLWDVELGGGNGLKYPNNRVISIGAQLSF